MERYQPASQHPWHSILNSTEELNWNFTGVRNAAGKNNEYEIKDDLPILKFYDAHKNDSAEVLAKEVLSNTDFWGEDLTKIPGLLDAVTEAMKMSETEGTYAVMQKCLKAAE